MNALECILSLTLLVVLEADVMHHVEENCCDNEECCSGRKECCCCCDCGPESKMSKETMEMRLTMVATDIWMKIFVEACEKEWKKFHGKSIQKLAAEHVKKAKKEWGEQVKNK